MSRRNRRGPWRGRLASATSSHPTHDAAADRVDAHRLYVSHEFAIDAHHFRRVPMTDSFEAQASAQYRSALTEVVGRDLTLVETVLEISAIPYGRPRDRTPSGVLAEWRGTCSTKHMLLAAIVSESWPECRPRLWHRVGSVTREFASRRWGERVAATIPLEGLVDVHTFATLDLEKGGTQIDVTFTLAGWDGRSDIPLACGLGDDHPAGADPLATKAALERAHCDYEARERFIAALSTITED